MEIPVSHDPYCVADIDVRPICPHFSSGAKVESICTEQRNYSSPAPNLWPRTCAARGRLSMFYSNWYQSCWN